MGAFPHRKLKDGVFEALRGLGVFPPKERAHELLAKHVNSL